MSRGHGVGLFRSRSVNAPAARAVPRDVESLERLVIDLLKATDEASTWRITVDSTVGSHGFSYGAVWLPDGRGHVEVGYEAGPLVEEMRASIAGRRVPAN